MKDHQPAQQAIQLPPGYVLVQPAPVEKPKEKKKPQKKTVKKKTSGNDEAQIFVLALLLAGVLLVLFGRGL